MKRCMQALTLTLVRVSTYSSLIIPTLFGEVRPFTIVYITQGEAVIARKGSGEVV